MQANIDSFTGVFGNCWSFVETIVIVTSEINSSSGSNVTRGAFEFVLNTSSVSSVPTWIWDTFESDELSTETSRRVAGYKTNKLIE
jgi:hypothetical protein